MIIGITINKTAMAKKCTKKKNDEVVKTIHNTQIDVFQTKTVPVITINKDNK